MSDRVIAISTEVVECGKRVSEIGSNTYDLQLVSSALSGKRAISINNQPIYSEQRIDNRSFDYLLKKKDAPSTTSANSGKYDAQSSDPFAEFQKVATNSNVDNNNQFGEFDDFANYDFGKKSEGVAVQKKEETPFGFDNNQNNEIKPENFQTNNFQTNNFSNFQKNFQNNDQRKSMINIVSADNFTTNNYGNYNNFLDLLDSTAGTSDTYGKPVEVKKKTLLQEITPDMSGKQMINKTLMTAVQLKKSAVQTATELKNKAMNKFESLI